MKLAVWSLRKWRRGRARLRSAVRRRVKPSARSFLLRRRHRPARAGGNGNRRTAPNAYVFDLRPIREKLGDRWDRYGPSVHRIAKRLIFRSLDGNGSFELAGDTYILTFDRLRRGRAQREGRRLYNEFLELLSKGKESGDAKGEARATAESPPVADGGRKPGRAGLLRRLVRRMKTFFDSGVGDRADAPAPQEANAPHSSPESIADAGPSSGHAVAGGAGAGGGHSFEEGAAARDVSRPPVAAPIPGGRPAVAARPAAANAGGPAAPPAGRRQAVSSARPAEAVPAANAGSASRGAKAPRPARAQPEPAWRRPREDRNELDELKLMREARAIEDGMACVVLRRQAEWSDGMANTSFPPPDLGFIYRSMWNLRSSYLTTYTAVPICWKNSMEIARGEDIVPAPRTPDKLSALDVLGLQNAIDVLTQLIEQKRQVLFMNVVHASTLTHKDMLAEFIALAENIPPEARRQLIFEIADIGDYAHSSEAVAMVRKLGPYSRAVTASVGLQDRNLAFWKQCGLMAVGADLSRDRRAEQEIMNDLTSFAALAKRCKLLCYLRELDKFSLTISAAGAGFDFLEGAAIGSSDSPENLALSRFNIENLYDDEPEVVWAD